MSLSVRKDLGYFYEDILNNLLHCPYELNKTEVVFTFYFRKEYSKNYVWSKGFFLSIHILSQCLSTGMAEDVAEVTATNTQYPLGTYI